MQMNKLRFFEVDSIDIESNASKRSAEKWKNTQKKNFFDALKDLGKRDFEKIALRVKSKNYDQVRQFYYKQLKAIKEVLHADDLKDEQYQVTALILWWEFVYSNKKENSQNMEARVQLFVAAFRQAIVELNLLNVKLREKQNAIVEGVTNANQPPMTEGSKPATIPPASKSTSPPTPAKSSTTITEKLAELKRKYSDDSAPSSDSGKVSPTTKETDKSDRPAKIPATEPPFNSLSKHTPALTTYLHSPKDFIQHPGYLPPPMLVPYHPFPYTFVPPPLQGMPAPPAQNNAPKEERRNSLTSLPPLPKDSPSRTIDLTKPSTATTTKAKSPSLNPTTKQDQPTTKPKPAESTAAKKWILSIEVRDLKDHYHHTYRISVDPTSTFANIMESVANRMVKKGFKVTKEELSIYVKSTKGGGKEAEIEPDDVIEEVLEFEERENLLVRKTQRA